MEMLSKLSSVTEVSGLFSAAFFCWRARTPKKMAPMARSVSAHVRADMTTMMVAWLLDPATTVAAPAALTSTPVNPPEKKSKH